MCVDWWPVCLVWETLLAVKVLRTVSLFPNTDGCSCVSTCPQIKELPQFNNQDKFEPSVAGQKMEMEKIVIYYVDEKGPEFSMRHLTGGVIAVIVVVIVAVIAGLLVLVSVPVCLSEYPSTFPTTL